MSASEPPKKRRKINKDDEDYVPSDTESILSDDTQKPGGEGDEDDEVVALSYDPTKVFYDASHDGQPNHPVYNKQFDEIRKYLSETVKKANKIIQENPSQYWSKLDERLKAIQQIPQPELVRIALVGSPGTGKSSLINSILDSPGLAVTGSSGSACTNVAVEFTSPLPGQSDDFSAEVVFYNESLRKCIQNLVEDYRRPIVSIHDDDETDDDEDSESRHMNNMQSMNQAQNAFRMLAGLLRSHSGLNKESKLKEYLSFEEDCPESSNKLDTVIHDICDSVHALIATECATRNKYSKFIQASTGHDLNAILVKYTREFVSEGTPQLWPIVKLVRIGIRNRDLLKHVIIADLPGLQDDNRLRCESTYEYLYSCDSAWVLSRIDRVLNLANVRETLHNLDYRMPGRVALVCTFSDYEVNQPLFEDLSRRFKTPDCAALKAAFDEAALKKKHITQLEFFYNRAPKGSDDRKTFKKLVDGQRVEIRVMSFNNKLALMRLRIAFVQWSMQFNFPTLKVFGVSNSYYEKLKFSNPATHSHRLQASDTGIKELRHYALQIPGDRMWQNTQRYFRGAFTNFSDFIAICVQSKEVQGRHEWQDKLQVPIQAILRHVEEYFDADCRLFNEKITSLIVTKKEKHKLSALEASKCWETAPFDHYTYNKFGRHKGSFGNKRVERSNWNEQLVASIKKDLRKEWDDLQTQQENRSDSLLTMLSARLQNSMSSNCVKEEVEKPLFVQQFEDMTTKQTDSLRNAILDNNDKLQRLVGRIRHRMNGVGPDAYVTAELDDTYNSIGQTSGLGMKKRMHAIMQAKLEAKKHNIVDTVVTNASDEFRIERRKHRDEMESQIRAIVKNVEENFNVMSEEFPADDRLNELRKALTALHENVIEKNKQKVDNRLKSLQRQYYASAP